MGGLRPNTLLLSWPVHTHGSSREAIDSEYHTFTGKFSQYNKDFKHSLSIIIVGVPII